MFDLQMKTIIRLDNAQYSFLITNILLIFYQVLSRSVVLDKGQPDKDCENNFFEGQYQPLNAINYYITRAISNFSANIACLILFWKQTVKKSLFGHYRNKSDAEKVLINFMMNDDNEKLIPLGTDEIISSSNISKSDMDNNSIISGQQSPMSAGAKPDFEQYKQLMQNHNQFKFKKSSSINDESENDIDDRINNRLTVTAPNIATNGNSDTNDSSFNFKQAPSFGTTERL